MMNRIESMSGGAVKAVVLTLLCLVSEIKCKPALEQDWPYLAPLQVQPGAKERPFYIDCVSSSECFKGFCCALGHQRFSIPKCQEYGGLGQHCHPGAVATAKNLTYLDGMTVEFKDVYDSMCPCSIGLTCDPVSSICVDENVQNDNTLDPYWLSKLNHLEDDK